MLFDLDLAEARANYTESVMECYTAVISESEKVEKEKAEDAKEELVPTAPTTEAAPK